MPNILANVKDRFGKNRVERLVNIKSKYYWFVQEKKRLDVLIKKLIRWIIVHNHNRNYETVNISIFFYPSSILITTISISKIGAHQCPLVRSHQVALVLLWCYVITMPLHYWCRLTFPTRPDKLHKKCILLWCTQKP